MEAKRGRPGLSIKERQGDDIEEEANIRDRAISGTCPHVIEY